MDTPSELELRRQDDALRRLARRLTARPHGADAPEELVQDTWVAALESGETPGSGWLVTVLRRAFGKAARGGANRRGRERAVARPEHTEPVDEILAREEARRVLVDALFALDEPERTCVALRYLEDLPPRRIARRLGVPVETVKTRLKRGIARLRARLDDTFDAGYSAWGLLLLPLAHRRPETGFLMTLTTMTTKLKLACVALSTLGVVVFTLRPFEARIPETTTARDGLEQAKPPSSTPSEARLGPATETATRRDAITHAPETAAKDDAAPGTGTLEVRVHWSDGTPAADVGLTVRAQSAPWHRWRDGKTSALGVARFEELQPGKIHVASDRGHLVTTSLRAGTTERFEFELPPGANIAGRVVDAGGRSVSGASVWLAPYDPVDGSVVAATDERGEFSIRSTNFGGWIGAQAPGHAPSRMPHVLAQPGATVEVVLTLGADPRSIAGRVVDPEGEPVAGASVLIVAAGDELAGGEDHGPAERQRFRPGPLVHTTTEDGRFAYDNAPDGACLLAVSARSWAPASRVLEAAPRHRTGLVIGLEPETRLEGRVLDALGTPVRLASVSLDTNLGRAWERSTLTSDDGEFALTGLPTGEFAVSLTTGQGHRRASFHARPGDVLRWDVRLGLGREIAGRLVDEAGAPLSSWWIQFSSSAAESPPDSVLTDGEGRFRIECQSERAHTLTIGSPESFMMPSRSIEGVEPPCDDLEIVIPHQEMPTARIIGVLHRARGTLDGVWVCPHGENTGRTVPMFPPDLSGAFEIGPLPPGKWTLRFIDQQGDLGVHEPVELEPNETADLGTIELE